MKKGFSSLGKILAIVLVIALLASTILPLILSSKRSASASADFSAVALAEQNITLGILMVIGGVILFTLTTVFMYRYMKKQNSKEEKNNKPKNSNRFRRTPSKKDSEEN